MSFSAATDFACIPTTLASGGMPAFGRHLTNSDADAVRAYIIERAHASLTSNSATQP